ncbi:MAG: hypothetical protein N3G20_03985, partial [Verrucomicrobiae bacterium]|nr:hypothetical protein [Verrucomicrobiae bacterium]
PGSALGRTDTGGSFTILGTKDGNTLGVVDAGTRVANDRNRNANGIVRALGVCGKLLHAMDGFTSVRTRDALSPTIDAGTATVTDRNSDANIAMITNALVKRLVVHTRSIFRCGNQ